MTQSPNEPANQEEAAPETAQSIEAEEAVLAAQLADLKDKLLRAMAETENLRRRHQRERAEAEQFAASAFARDMLSVADNLRRALDGAREMAAKSAETPEPLKNLIAGIEVTERELITAFERHDIKRIDPLGEKFDAHFHQAMFEIEDQGQPAGTILRVVAPGYIIAGRLLRAAMVGVAKGGPGGGPEASAQGGKVDTTA